MCPLASNQLDKTFFVIVGAAFILFQTSVRLIGSELWPDFFFVFFLVLVLNPEPRLQKITRLHNTTRFLSVMKEHFLFFTAMPQPEIYVKIIWMFECLLNDKIVHVHRNQANAHVLNQFTCVYIVPISRFQMLYFERLRTLLSDSGEEERPTI